MSGFDIDPLEILSRAFVIFIAALALGLFIPALIASHNGVFYKVDVENRIIQKALVKVECRDELYRAVPVTQEVEEGTRQQANAE